MAGNPRGGEENIDLHFNTVFQKEWRRCKVEVAIPSVVVLVQDEADMSLYQLLLSRLGKADLELRVPSGRSVDDSCWREEDGPSPPLWPRHFHNQYTNHH